jgi:hypothetical protein
MTLHERCAVASLVTLGVLAFAKIMALGGPTTLACLACTVVVLVAVNLANEGLP